MADNVPITAGSGTDVATDQVSGTLEHVQLFKQAYSADGVRTLITADANGLLVAPAPVNVISTANSSTAVLAGGAVFTGTSEDISNYANVMVSVTASHVSATDGLSIQMSSDGTNWDYGDVYTIPAASGKVFAMNPVAKFFRIVYTNGGTLQTSFRLQTIFKRFYAQARSNRPSDGYSNELDLDQTQAFGMVWNGTTWDRLPGSVANGVVVTTTLKATYRASTTAVLVPAVTSPNPWLTIYGSATKTIKIHSIVISGLTLTAVAYLNIGLRKYSTAVTGGTASTLTQTPLDANSAAGTATNVAGYTAIPTAGTTVSDVTSRRVIGQATTAAAAGIPQIVDFDFSSGQSQPVTLRGTAQGIGLFWITAPATTVSMLARIEWTEE